MLLFLTFGCIACSDPSKEISGTYETVVSTTSVLGLDTLASSDTIPADSSAVSTSLELSGSETSSPERTLSLELYEDQRAEFTTTFLNEKTATVQKGTWTLLDNNRVRTYFIEKDGRFFRDTLTFHRDGSRLVLRGKHSSIMDEVNLVRIE